jgi:RNA polymerase sigma-70 factor, ECF subfamily
VRIRAKRSDFEPFETFAVPTRSGGGVDTLTTAPDTDSELMDRIAQGDRQAFGVFFDRHAGAATRYAIRLVGDTAASEDAVSAAFVRLLDAARARTIDPGRGSLRGLLFRSVRNLCIDWLRGRSRNASLHGVDVPGPSGGDDIRIEIESALAALPEIQRSALLLRVDGGLSYLEIAAALGSSLAQVKNWIFRARRTLAERLRVSERPKEVGRAV